eukprot:2578346-Rhodomonas_salina.1
MQRCGAGPADPALRQTPKSFDTPLWGKAFFHTAARSDINRSIAAWLRLISPPITLIATRFVLPPCTSVPSYKTPWLLHAISPCTSSLFGWIARLCAGPGARFGERCASDPLPSSPTAS